MKEKPGKVQQREWESPLISLSKVFDTGKNAKRPPLAGRSSVLFGFERNLGVDSGNNTGANGTAALADSETQALFDGDGGDQLNVHHNVIARHAHLGALGQGDNAGNVSSSEIELRTVVVEERSMASAFFPVSYTHLDVYKRQLLGLLGGLW